MQKIDHKNFLLLFSFPFITLSSLPLSVDFEACAPHFLRSSFANNAKEEYVVVQNMCENRHLPLLYLSTLLVEYFLVTALKVQKLNKGSKYIEGYKRV